MDTEQRLYSWGASDDYHALPYKTMDFFKNLELDYDWYILIDDDTYVFHDRLKRLLANYSPNLLISMGCILDHVDNELFRYTSGGAGTVLSKTLYKKVCTYVRTCPNPIIHWCSDICVGKWLLDIKKDAQKQDRIMFELDNRNFHPITSVTKFIIPIRGIQAQWEAVAAVLTCTSHVSTFVAINGTSWIIILFIPITSVAKTINPVGIV
jgi:hypothetical protein